MDSQQSDDSIARLLEKITASGTWPITSISLVPGGQGYLVGYDLSFEEHRWLFYANKAQLKESENAYWAARKQLIASEGGGFQASSFPANPFSGNVQKPASLSVLVNQRSMENDATTRNTLGGPGKMVWGIGTGVMTAGIGSTAAPIMGTNFRDFGNVKPLESLWDNPRLEPTPGDMAAFSAPAFQAESVPSAAPPAEHCGP